MRKILFLLSALCLFSVTYAQTITPKQERVKNFKNTETIFILSDIYDTATYDKILKDVWTVTPYKIVKASDFNLGSYLDGKYSFAMLDFAKVRSASAPKHNVPSPPTYSISYHISFFLFENDKKQKEFLKFSKKSPAKQKKYNLFEEYRINVGNILLYPNSEFSEELDVNKENKDIHKTMYSEKAFYNYNLGFLKNYFQKMSSLIYNMTDKMELSACIPESKNLKKQTLYIPSYVTRDCGENYDQEKTKEELKDFFAEYKYPLDVIATDELDAKIMSGEEFYYLRYYRRKSYKLLEVVNSKTGEIVYRCHQSVAYYIKPHYMNDIEVSIDTGKV